MRPGAGLEIRFDSFGRSSEPRTIRFAGLRETVRASSLEEVLPALEKVERAVSGGLHAAGFVTYEAAAAMDPALVTHPGDPALPLVLFGIFDEKIESPLSIDFETVGEGVEREAEGERWQGAHAGSAASDPTGSGLNAEPRVGRTFPDGGESQVESQPERDVREIVVDDPQADSTHTDYDAAVATILDYIAAGDSYQVNFSFRLRGGYHGPLDALYHRICRAQQSDFCASLRFDRFAILSASPELFFHRVGRRIRMRPMKGTRPRGRWTAEDDAMAAVLAESPKDRAENLMIVDLLRNDLGRVASFGSVKVRSLYDIERYPTVFQMTSTVEAEVDEETSLVDLFRALFPCGSVTGAPKVRTTEIIHELESGPRGVYTGAIGFVSPGESIFSVAIRTVTLDLARSEYELGIGSGITADSDAASEYEECLNKGAFLQTSTPEVELIESLRLEVPGGYHRLAGHLARLCDSARYFDFPYDRDAVTDKLAQVAAGLSAGTYKIRLLLALDGKLTGTAEPISPQLPPARLGVADFRVTSSDRFLYHKTTYREPYRRALAEWPGCDDVVLRNERGELSETCTGNLVLELDGEMVTPPISSGLLGGVMRKELLQAERIHEGVLTIADLHRAKRIFVINSVRGWRDAYLLPTGSRGPA